MGQNLRGPLNVQNNFKINSECSREFAVMGQYLNPCTTEPLLPSLLICHDFFYKQWDYKHIQMRSFCRYTIPLRQND